ncbi:glycosyltransferase family protein [Methanobrevibacter arboriphilus]
MTKKYISDTYIPNHELNKLYSSCKILLNDHWQDMAKNGFVSNRIFDGLASGAFIISDEFKDSKKLFGDFLVTYSDKKTIEKVN